MKRIVIAWLRQDLRLQDNPVLADAASRELPVLPVYIHAPEEDDQWPPGAASRWWLHHALADLRDRLAEHGLPLVIRQGDSGAQLAAIIGSLRRAKCAVDAVVSGRLYEPARVERDRRVREELARDGVDWRQHDTALLIEPEHVRNRSGDPFRVFTPFWKHLRTLAVAAPNPLAPGKLTPSPHVPEPVELERLSLLPRIAWDGGLREHWDPTGHGARRALQSFLDEEVNAYRQRRDLPAVAGTSRLSPYLHHGQLGPRQVWHAVHQAGAAERDGGVTFLSELAWREFAYHLLHHFPHTAEQALNPAYRDFPWKPDDDALRAWQRGLTGFPLVDAGMRQLWRTGWMHNRVRMVTASLLVKHLLQPWQAGARWFWDTLVDADLASNSMGWQWVAGSGADAAPYFRIFNPTLQGEKFDPDGDYVRAFVPELSRLPARYIHRPWEASQNVLAEAGVRLGQDYPAPFIDHRAGRERALAALKANRGRN